MAGHIDTEDAPRILSEEDCKELLARVHALAKGGGESVIRVLSWWQGELRWARNRANLSSDRRDILVEVGRHLSHGGRGGVTLNRIDDASLEHAVRAAERRANQGLGWRPGYEGPVAKYPEFVRPPSAPVWSEVTVGIEVEDRAELARKMIVPAEAEGFYSAGYLEVREAASATYTTAYPELRTSEHRIGEGPYIRWTQAQCSNTVRDASGMGSGWAGLSSYDLGRITAETEALAERAVQKCRASRNPVALEPGRYTVILEPQAVADLMEQFPGLGRPDQTGSGPWGLGYDEAIQAGRAKFGLKVVDERITISHDPMDPLLGIIMSPLERPGPVTWIENGVLKELGYGYLQALQDFDGVNGLHQLRGSLTGYRMSGGDTSMEEMIRTTRRGLLVTRFSDVRGIDRESGLSTGITRDGLWLIENGEITKAVRNFRFTESPLFMLNNVEQIGEAVPVFRPTKEETGRLTPAIVPAIKARDFSFTSLVDAV